MALFHCMVRHGTVRYGSLLGGFPLGTVPGTWYFFSTTSAEVPSDPYRYQNVMCKLEGDTGVNSQTSPVPLPQKCISSRPNPTKKLGENPVPFHSRKNDSHSLPLPCCCFFFSAEICQLQ